MKRYLLFTGYYPRGGWNDLAGQFDTINEALAADRKDWAQVVDTHSGAVIWTQGADSPRLVAVGSSRWQAERAKLRPANYLELGPREQWAIDKQLGILDWDGSS